MRRVIYALLAAVVLAAFWAPPAAAGICSAANPIHDAPGHTYDVEPIVGLRHACRFAYDGPGRVAPARPTGLARSRSVPPAARVVSAVNQSEYDDGENLAPSRAPIATRGAAKVLAQPRMMIHHLFPQQFRKFFDKAGVKIDNFTVRISETTHLKGVHGRGVGDLPGGWNARWQQFIEANPNATAKDVFQFGGSLMDEFGLGGLPIIPFR